MIGAARPTPLARAAACLLAGTGLVVQAQGQTQVQTPVLTQALPTGPQVIQGQASVLTRGSQMTVRNTPGTIVNWQGFSIGAANSVYFDQASAASKVLNRVVGADPSQILGTLASNGAVWLLNPNGVLFGANARVDVASLVASTLHLNDNDFLSARNGSQGRYRFTAAEGGGATLRNDGSLNSSFGGQVVLLGARVENSGSIGAPGGQIALVSAQSVELVDTALPNLSVRVNVPAGEVLNLGRLVAAGGRVDIHGAIVNQQGLVQATSLQRDAGGEIVLQASDTLTLAAGSRTLADGAAGATEARGGRIALLGAQVGVLDGAELSASGAAGGGAIFVGGGAQGRDASLPNSRAVYVGPEASLRADALERGDGGSIVLWSDQATRAFGRFSARGGPLGGHGGALETSGGWLDARPAALDLGAAQGRAGNWLLDPNNITIQDTGPQQNISAGPNFASTNDASVLTTASIAAALNAGNSVTVSTANAGQNSQAGDIYMNAATLSVSPSSPVTLSLRAARDVVINASNITSSGSALSLDLVSAGTGKGVVVLQNSVLTTRGGSVSLGGSNVIQLPTPQGLTAGLYKASVAYVPGATDPAPRADTLIGVKVVGTSLNLGSGDFTATGTSPEGGTYGVAFNGNSVLSARNITMIGANATLSVAGDGLRLEGQATDITATHGMTLKGWSAGFDAIRFGDGVRVTLDGVPNSGAFLDIQGVGKDRGVVFTGNAYPVAAGVSGRGSRIAVVNGTFLMDGQGVNRWGTIFDNPVGGVGPALDLSAATAATLSGDSSSSGARSYEGVELLSVGVVVPSSVSTVFDGKSRAVFLSGVSLSGNGGDLSVRGQGVTVSASSISSSGAAMGLNFAATGATPTGVSLTNTTISTGGGDVRFGAAQQVCSAVLGCTADALSPWVQRSGDSSAAGLGLVNTVVDAGSGRVWGGGAGGVGVGVLLSGSVITARDITLAGRSDGLEGIRVAGGSYAASRNFALDGLNAGPATAGLSIQNGSSLLLGNSAGTAGALMSLTGTNKGASMGLMVSAGNAGTANETTLSVDGAALLMQGTASGAGIGLYALGTAAAPGGLLINTLGASSATLSGNNLSTGGNGMQLSNINLLGPQAATGSHLDLLGTGGAVGNTASLQISGSTISSGSPVLVRGDGLLLSQSRITGDAGVSLQTRTGAGAPVGAAVSISGSTVRTTDDGAYLRIEGSDGTAVRGAANINNGVGAAIVDSQFLAAGSGSHIVFNGRGAASGDGGVTLTRSALDGGTLDITSTSGPLAFSGVTMNAGTINLTSPSRIYSEDGNFSPNPSKALNLTFSNPAGATIGANGSGDAASAAGLSATLSSLAPAVAVSLRGPALNFTAPVTSVGRLTIQSDALTLQPGARLASAATGDAVVVSGYTAGGAGSFTNNAGAAALATPQGRWVLDLTDPRKVQLGGLQGSFTAYDLAARPWLTDASGNLVTPAAGNALGYSLSTADIAASPLAGLLVKPYDGTRNITLDPLSWTITGLLSNDTLTFGGSAIALLADKNAGQGKAVTLDPSTQFTVKDAAGHPVFGYAAPVFKANVSPAPADLTAATSANQSSLAASVFAVTVPTAMSTPTEGRVLDVMTALSTDDGRTGEGNVAGLGAPAGADNFSSGPQKVAFKSVNFQRLPRDEIQTLLAARAGYKRKVFATSIARLEQDPALADVRACLTVAELATGQCLLTEALKQEMAVIAARAEARARKGQPRKVKQVALPKMERKLALLVGINKYQDKDIPELSGALRDARAMRDLLETRQGYETTLVEDGSREAIVRAFNKLALEAGADDSVVIFYAGHGELVQAPGTKIETGYWLPADSQADAPESWISNADIARLVGLVGARQLMLISDSCYSGTLAGTERVQVDRQASAVDLLSRKAAVVMSSGGAEPVADQGKQGHSIFTWHLMKSITEVADWQVGSSLFERVRAAVTKEFPQTPQYGASRGHQGNTDYLFERREYEAAAP